MHIVKKTLFLAVILLSGATAQPAGRRIVRAAGAFPSLDVMVREMAAKKKAEALQLQNAQFIARIKDWCRSADINEASPIDKKTLLHEAARLDLKAACRYLMQNGAVPVRDAAGLLPADYATDEALRVYLRSFSTLAIASPIFDLE
jgi:hypothetical protein